MIKFRFGFKLMIYVDGSSIVVLCLDVYYKKTQKRMCSKSYDSSPTVRPRINHSERLIISRNFPKLIKMYLLKIHKDILH